MSNLAAEALTPDLLDEAVALFAGDAYEGVIGDLRQDVSAERPPLLTVTARNNANLVGLATLSTPVAPGAPWTFSTMGLSNSGSTIAQLATTSFDQFPVGALVEWWMRGALVDDTAAVAVGNEFKAGRRIEVMARDLNAVPIETALADDAAKSEPFETRAFTPEDAQRLAEINNAAFAGHDDRANWTAQTVLDEAAKFGNRFEDIRLAPATGAFAGFDWTREVREGEGEIYVLATDPSARGTGLGGKLLEAGLAHLVQTYGVERAVLYVDASNTGAIRLYEKHGFTNANQPLVSFRRQF